MELGYENAPVQQCPTAGAEPEGWSGREEEEEGVDKSGRGRGGAEKGSGEEDRRKNTARQAADEKTGAFMKEEVSI